ncbi:MAG: acyltransferase [Candidatus Omnitrophica bacterium]|nr:acyltransferase [Candidatus Omnitrophota bacterium]
MIELGIKALLRFRYFFWKIVLSFRGGRLGKRVKIYNHVVIASSKKNPIHIGSDVHLMQGAIISAANGGSIEIGAGSYIGEYCVLNSQGKMLLGKKVLLAPQCVIVDFNHQWGDCERSIDDQGTVGGEVIIEDDVWLGTSVKVLKGVRIGKGSVIGAGAVVTKDIPPYSVAVGVPARIIRKRK